MSPRFGNQSGGFGLKLKILGYGTELAAVLINRDASEKIEAWFRAHPDFGRNTRSVPVPEPSWLG